MDIPLTQSRFANHEVSIQQIRQKMQPSPLARLKPSQRAGAIGKPVDFHSNSLQHRDKQVGHRRLLIELQVLIMSQSQLTTSGKKQRVVAVLVSAAIAAAVQNQCSIQHD